MAVFSPNVATRPSLRIFRMSDSRLICLTSLPYCDVSGKSAAGRRGRGAMVARKGSRTARGPSGRVKEEKKSGCKGLEEKKRRGWKEA